MVEDVICEDEVARSNPTGQVPRQYCGLWPMGNDFSICFHCFQFKFCRMLFLPWAVLAHGKAFVVCSEKKSTRQSWFCRVDFAMLNTRQNLLPCALDTLPCVFRTWQIGSIWFG